jgi:hypothetical protein
LCTVYLRHFVSEVLWHTLIVIFAYLFTLKAMGTLPCPLCKFFPFLLMSFSWYLYLWILHNLHKYLQIFFLLHLFRYHWALHLRSRQLTFFL